MRSCSCDRALTRPNAPSTDGDPAPRQITPTEETAPDNHPRERSNRNSIQYKESDLDRALGLRGANSALALVGEDEMIAAVNASRFPGEEEEGGQQRHE